MAQNINEAIQAIITGIPGKVGVYARYLNTGATVEINADQLMPTMSAAKTFILLTYAEAVVTASLSPDKRITIQADDILPGTGAIRYCQPGLNPDLSDLAYLMIVFSDNVATNLLLEQVGGAAAINGLLARLGLNGATLEGPVMRSGFATATPRALAEAYAVLAQPERAGYQLEAAQLALNTLRQHQDVEGLSRYLPWNPHAADFGFELPLAVYSKSGQFPGVQVEAGLFITPRSRYVLAVMSSDLPDPQNNAASMGSNLLADVGKVVYEAWQ